MRAFLFVGVLFVTLGWTSCSGPDAPPNIVLIMADDQGWGQTGYYNHPILQTPHLDAMAANGLRFDRFYAGAPNCSPTRASVLTGRSNDRTGVLNHGYALRRQERTLAQLLKEAGYATGHFGKWHLNGLRGPGVPILDSDPRSPGAFGFDEWLSVTNFFDRNPILSQRGRFREFEGDSSEIVITEALAFIRANWQRDQHFLAVIWFGTPHSPWVAGSTDKESFSHLSEDEQNHYGELVAMDRSIGLIRRELRQLGIAENTLVWFCSDNGGLRPFGPATVGGLRGWKNTLWEGGLRVPAIVEWPAGIPQPRVTSFPAVTMDIVPTLTEIAGLSQSLLLQPQDGISLKALFSGEIGPRNEPIPFRHTGRSALIDNDYKLITEDWKGDQHQLFHLASDPQESQDLFHLESEIATRMKQRLDLWNQSVEQSLAGKDYPEGQLAEPDPEPLFWTELPGYEPYFEQWKQRPEYQSRLANRGN